MPLVSPQYSSLILVVWSLGTYILLDDDSGGSDDANTFSLGKFQKQTFIQPILSK